MGRIPTLTTFQFSKAQPPSFSAVQKPLLKQLGDYASVSSVSSYANSIVSQFYTLVQHHRWTHQRHFPSLTTRILRFV